MKKRKNHLLEIRARDHVSSFKCNSNWSHLGLDGQTSEFLALYLNFCSSKAAKLLNMLFNDRGEERTTVPEKEMMAVAFQQTFQ